MEVLNSCCWLQRLVVRRTKHSGNRNSKKKDHLSTAAVRDLVLLEWLVFLKFHNTLSWFDLSP